MNPDYPAVAQRALHRCEYCHAPEAIFNLAFEVEHVIPSSQDGGNHESNLVLACRSCNLFKSDRTHSTDSKSGSIMPLFHPRKDIWEDHFQMDFVTGEIVGLTPIGRATTTQLRMNGELQSRARQSWIRLGIMT